MTDISEITLNVNIPPADNSSNEKDEIIQSIFRAAPIGIGMVINRVITEINDTLCRITGYTPDELIGSSSRILYPSDEEFEFAGREKYRQISETGYGSVETKWKKKDGEVIDIILSSSAIDNADLSRGVTFTALDISARKKFEENLKIKDIQLNYIASRIPAALFQYYVKKSGEMGFYYISESSEQVFGLKNDIDDFFDQFAAHISPDYRENYLHSISNSVEKKIPWEYEGIFNKDSGESIWFRGMSNPVELEDEIIFNGFVIDITDQIKYLSLSERAAKLDSLSLLAGGIAHDFNNALAGIFGYIDIARNYSKADPTVSRYLDNAMQIFDRTKALTGQLLTFAKGGDPVKKPGSITQLLIEITRYLMKGSEHTYEFNFCDNLYKCEFDNEQINHAMENIITNALEAMPAGGNLCISAENFEINKKKTSFLKPGKYLKITIKDSGTGIPEKNLPRIFDPFFTTKLASKGMGLASSHSIINRHSGYIEVISSEGKGAAFLIFLPAIENQDIEEVYHDLSPHTGKGNILLMDDEVFIRETVGEMLKLMGYNVCKVNEGNEAIRVVEDSLNKGENFTAIILDLTIPNGMGGKETISRLRKMGVKSAAFASSGYSDDPIISSPEDYGFTDSIRKPYRMEDLTSMLNFYLNNQNS